MPTEFNHITVPSQDLQVSIAFYTAMGMTLIEHEPLHHAHFENANHEVIFTAYYNSQRPSYEVTVYYEVGAIEDFEIRFRESVLTPTSTKKWGGKELIIRDPDGNHVVLYERLTSQSIPPWQQETNNS